MGVWHFWEGGEHTYVFPRVLPPRIDIEEQSDDVRAMNPSVDAKANTSSFVMIEVFVSPRKICNPAFGSGGAASNHWVRRSRTVGKTSGPNSKEMQVTETKVAEHMRTRNIINLIFCAISRLACSYFC